jgi:hypothetical protein
LLPCACLAMLVGCTSSTSEANERAKVDAPVVAPPEREGTSVIDDEDLDRLALACEGEPLRQRFSALSPADLERLADEAPTNLRLLALWEHDRRFAGDGALDPSSVDRLDRELAATLGTPPPRWWIEQLASAKQRSDDAGGPPYYDTRRTENGDRRGEWQTGPGGTRVRSGGALLLSETKGQLSYDLSMHRVVLGPLPSDPGTMIEHARRQGATTIYWAAFSQGSGGFRFPLHAVDSEGKEVWTAEVCGPNRQILGGLGHLTAEIVVLESGAGIAVFTAESHGVALDVFDPKTGARTMAWSSDFWFAR